MSDIEAKGDALQHSLVGPAREAQNAQSWADRQRDENTQKDRERMDRAWGNENARAGDPALEIWDADKEKARRTRGPMEQFGSVGFIFAMAASAFTRTPMTSALNAGAAAMTAIQQGDEKAYESAYKAWKDNSDLAIRRFDMEHRLYEDANKLMTTDMALWTQKTQEIAAQFDNQKTIAMLNAGMYPQVLEAQSAQAKAKLDLVKAQQGFEDYDRQQKMISDRIKALRKAHPDWKDDNKGLEQSVAEANAYRDVVQAMKGMQTRTSPNQQQYELIRQKYEGDPDAEGKIAEEYAKFVREQHLGTGSAGVRPGSINEDRTKMDAAIRAEPGHEKWTDAQVIEERNKRLKASTTSPTGNNKVGSPELERSKGVAKVLQEEIDSGRLAGASAADIEKRREELMHLAKERETPLSPRNRDALAGQIGRIDRANEIIDKTQKLMRDHGAITGFGGAISRREEIMGNLLGSKSTAYKQFESDIYLLQEWTKRMLSNAASESRPLKSSELAISKIVPGLSLGDTVQHTHDQLKELKHWFTEMREEDVQRYSGSWTPDAPKGGKGKSGGSSWRSQAIPDAPGAP
jgi:hypothetical protein